MPASNAPSRAGYLGGCLVMALGAMVSVAAILVMLPAAFSVLTSLEMPGSHEVAFEEPGSYYLYYERRGVVNGRVYAGDGSFSGIWLTVHRPDGTEVLVEPPGSAMSYQTGERAGEAIAVFEIDEPGTYRVGARYDEPGGDPVLMAVGPSILSAMLGAMAVIIGSMLGGLAVGSLLWLRTYLLRAREAAAPEATSSA